MFAQRLTREQKRQLVLMAAQMAVVDERVRPSELSVLEDLVGETGTAKDAAGTLDPSVFDDRPSRIVALLNLIVVALIDRHLHVREQKLFERIRAEFGLSDEDVDRIWVAAETVARLHAEMSMLMAE